MASSMPEVWKEKNHEKIPQVLLRAVSDLLQRTDNRLPAFCCQNRFQASLNKRHRVGTVLAPAGETYRAVRVTCEERRSGAYFALTQPCPGKTPPTSPCAPKNPSTSQPMRSIVQVCLESCGSLVQILVPRSFRWYKTAIVF